MGLQSVGHNRATDHIHTPVKNYFLDDKYRSFQLCQKKILADLHCLSKNLLYLLLHIIHLNEYNFYLYLLYLLVNKQRQIMSFPKQYKRKLLLKND